MRLWGRECYTLWSLAGSGTGGGGGGGKVKITNKQKQITSVPENYQKKKKLFYFLRSCSFFAYNFILISGLVLSASLT